MTCVIYVICDIMHVQVPFVREKVKSYNLKVELHRLLQCRLKEGFQISILPSEGGHDGMYATHWIYIYIYTRTT